MDRRMLIGVLAGGFLAAPVAAAIEKAAKVYRVGWLALGGPFDISGLRRGLRELGWIEGRNIIIEERFASNQPDRLAVLAGELVELKVDLIVTESTLAALAAQKATSVIPIVTAGCSNPVERGLVQSLAHPGGNITGMTNNTGAGFNATMAELLKEAAPKVSRVAVLWSPNERQVLEELQAASPALGMTFLDAGAGAPAEVPVVLAAAVKAGADGLFVNASSLNSNQRTVIAEFALAHRLPLICGHTKLVEAGGLMSYWTNFAEVYRQSAAYVDKILKGAKPGDLPVQQPTKFDLWINLKTARALGLTIPQSLLLRADQVIR
jgi:putative ABC transport system substrate-binding protein